ncbi:MAG: hypothetical protein BroJett039_06950 [Chloroflexota bacterium]|nr:MAG: hypothetical protein BroJett039_06950 [Chloroflexota bacterium]
MMPYRTIKKRIKPEQVHDIAARFRQTRDRVNQMTDEFERAGRELEPTWEGNAKNKFYGEYSPVPGQLRALAELLNRLAGEIENITVEVEEREWYSK